MPAALLVLAIALATWTGGCAAAVEVERDDAGRDGDGGDGPSFDGGRLDGGRDASGPLDGTIERDAAMDAATIEPDARTDATIGVDSGTVAADAGIDAPYDAGIDAPDDAGIDAPYDAGIDAPYDAGIGTPDDAGTDAAFDAGIDAPISCAPGLTPCGVRCVDLHSDEGNCGACSAACGATCRGGVCARAIDVSMGGSHACAALDNGELFCWGNNFQGQLGDGTRTARLSPTLVPGIDAVGVHAGYGYTCALLRDGGVVCWGAGSYGQLGDGTRTLFRYAPGARANDLSGAIAIDGGASMTCALRYDGRVLCWGQAYNDRFGDGSIDDKLVPFEIPGITSAVQVGVGGGHACVVLADTTAQCWGVNTAGQVGDGSVSLSRPPTVPEMLSMPARVDSGSEHTCSMVTSGEVLCWGNNHFGQLGDGASGRPTNPTPRRTLGLPLVRYVAAEDYSSFAIARDDGALWAWGSNNWGTLGDGTNATRTLPVRITTVAPPVREVSSTGSNTCFLVESGHLYCSGYNYNGELGLGNTTPTMRPLRVAF